MFIANVCFPLPSDAKAYTKEREREAGETGSISISQHHLRLKLKCLLADKTLNDNPCG